MLIGSRAIQGIGAALMMPATLSIITNTFPAAERGRAIGIWAGVSALALSIGPVVGGALTEYVSWRAIFFINLPVAVGAVAATVFAVRESRDETIDRRVDYPGIFALTAGLTAIVLALIEGNSWGWTSTSILSLLAGGLIGLAIFVAIELRVSAPMVEFALFKTRQFIGSNLVAFIITFAMMGTFFFMALYMQDILGYSALEAGIRFLPTTIVIAVVAPISGRLADRLGPATPMSAGLAVLAVSMFMFAGINTGTTYAGLVIPFVLMGLGIALVMSPMSTAAMNAVSAQKSGVASGVLQMSRMIGASVGVAATGAIFQSQLGSGFDPASLATAPEQARATFVDALSSAMLLAGFVVVAGLVVSLTLVRGARASGSTRMRQPRRARQRCPRRRSPRTSSRPALARRLREGCSPLAGSPRRIRSAGHERGIGEVEARERLDRHRSQALDRLPVGELHGRGLGRPGVEDHRRDLEPRAADRLDREQRVVDRPQARRGDHHHRQCQVPGEVPHQVIGGERHEEAAHSLADQEVRVLGRRQRRAAQYGPGSISSPASSAARWGETGGP